MVSVGLVLAFLVLLALGVPVIAALALLAVAGIVVIGDLPLVTVGQIVSSTTTQYILISIPLFILTGELMNRSGIARRIFSFAESLLGHVTGGLAQVNLASSTLMAGMSGSSIADVALTTKIFIPVMTRAGYSPSYSSAVTVMSAMVAPLIPPSIAMIIYGVIAEVSIGRLFVAGIIPGLILIVCLGGGVLLTSRRRGYRRSGGRESLSTVILKFRAAFWALLLPVIIVGGIRLGFFAPTEAAGIAVVYTGILGMFVYRELRLPQLKEVLVRTAVDTGIVMLIIAAAAPIGWLITVDRMPQRAADALGGLTLSPTVFALSTLIFLLILGALIETTVVLVLVAPIIAPIGLLAGVDPVHLGVVVVLGSILGTITPPFGQAVFVCSAIGGVPAEKIFRDVLVLFPTLLAAAILITVFPQSYLWLVDLVY